MQFCKNNGRMAVSRLSRMNRSFSARVRSMWETIVPFCGVISTRSSFCRRMNASRTGVRLTCSFAASSCVLTVVPGASCSEVIFSRITR